MLTNPRAERVRSVAALARRSVRARRGLFLAEGPQVVREAIAHRPGSITGLYVDHEAAGGSGPVAALAARAEAAGLPVTHAAPAVLAAMCDTQTPQGILAVCALPSEPAHSMLEAVLRPAAGQAPMLLAVLAEIRDPGNAGTVIRGADAAGADAVLFSADSVDPFNPKCVRSTAGSLFHLPVVAGIPVDELVDRLRGAGLRVLAAAAGAARSIDDADLVTPHAWVFGNEARGLPAEVVERCDEGVRVPLYGKAESLNLAMAATVCLYASAGAQHRSFDAMVRHGEIEPATREFSAPRRQLLRSGRTTAPIGDELRGDR